MGQAVGPPGTELGTAVSPDAELNLSHPPCAMIEISCRRHVKNAAAGDPQCLLKKKNNLFLVWIYCFLIKGNRLPPPHGCAELPRQMGLQELFNAPSCQAVMFN